jgi:hypothetical protein
MAKIEGPSEGSGSISRHDRVQYEREYQQGIDLFQRALSEYDGTKDLFKREAFHDVMERAMVILNDTARELKRSDLLDQNQKIAQAFSQMNTTELAKDLHEAKKNA